MSYITEHTISRAPINKEPVGWCYNLSHQGALYTKHYKKHKCKEKNCPFFKKNTEHQFWAQEEIRKLRNKTGGQIRKAYLNAEIKRGEYQMLSGLIEIATTTEDFDRLKRIAKVKYSLEIK